MILCITEKPSVGRDIARILGADKKQDGYFEGNGYCVTWTFGHLCSLKEPHDYSGKWKKWTLSSIPMIPRKFGIKLINDKGSIHQFHVIEKLIGECERIVNCGDAGQEGELIQRWVMQKAGCEKPVSRLWISSLTDDAIKEGFRNLRPAESFDSLYMAGLCRAIGDWVLGINATRLYSLKYGGPGQVVSIGRVQTPTLALIVNRQHEIENFIPKDTWEIRSEYRGVGFSATTGSFNSEADAEQIVRELTDKEMTITGVSCKKGTEAPPRLWDLTSLQVECNKKFGLSADTTLKTIQSLYEKKLTSYPRVDTTYLSDDIYPKCSGILNGLKTYQDLLIPLRGKKLKKDKKVFDSNKVTDHHAIIPTGIAPRDLNETETNVYDTVARRFIAVFYPNCEFEQTTVKSRVGEIDFKATGKTILSEGWKTVYQHDSNPQHQDKNNPENKKLPSFHKGEHGPQTPSVVKKTSQPPKYFTEGTLLKAMETAGNMVEDEDLRESLKANGIGRPSTRAAIIENLYKREYIERVRKSIRATQAGVDLINLIQQKLLKSAELTGIWENRLRMIEKNEYDATAFIIQIKQLIQEITISVLKDNSTKKLIAETGKPAAGSKKKKN